MNQVQGTAETGTGVPAIAWQYPPHILRTITELKIPAGVTKLGHDAFLNDTNFTNIAIPSSVTHIDVSAFHGCSSLTDMILPASITKIEEWTFAGCSSMTRISIPASVTSIGGAAFQKAGVTDVYYGGTEAQWKAMEIGGYNYPLNKATIHYNSLLADVKTGDWFARPVAWALETGVTNGTGKGNFSPSTTCTQGQILTFLWRAKGCPEPAGRVSGAEFYAKAVQWAQEQGLIDSRFKADSPCTRADVVTYLWKLAGSPSAGGANFSDVPASCAPAVAWAVQQNITNGTGNGQFSPTAPCTRGQIVTFFYRALAE